MDYLKYYMCKGMHVFSYSMKYRIVKLLNYLTIMVNSKKFVFFVTESAEKSGNFEQASQRRLFLYVHAFSCYRDRDSGCRHLPTDQILVITNTTSFPLVVSGCRRVWIFNYYFHVGNLFYLAFSSSYLLISFRSFFMCESC